MAKKKNDFIVDVPVSFGSVNFGKKNARIGVTLNRDDMSISAADKNLCDRRLIATIKAAAPGDQESQGRFDGMEEDLEMDVNADVKKLGLQTDSISFGLTVALKGLNRDKFSNFAAREGRMVVASSEEIPEAERTDAEDPE